MKEEYTSLDYHDMRDLVSFDKDLHISAAGRRARVKSVNMGIKLGNYLSENYGDFDASIYAAVLGGLAIELGMIWLNPKMPILDKVRLFTARKNLLAEQQ